MNSPIEPDTEARKASLFEGLAPPSHAPVEQARTQETRGRAQGSPRLVQPNCLQVELRASDLESLMSEDHRARLVWGYVVRQDLSKLIQVVTARVDRSTSSARPRPSA